MIRVGSKSGDEQVDIATSESIEKMYMRIRKFDALVSTAGSAHFGSFDSMKEEDF